MKINLNIKININNINMINKYKITGTALAIRYIIKWEVPDNGVWDI